MIRDDAILELARRGLADVDSARRYEIIHEWSGYAEEMLDWPAELREEVSRPDSVEDPGAARFDPVVLEHLRLRLAECSNAYLSTLLGLEVVGPEVDRLPCVCCGYRVLEHRGHYEVCPVCLWEDDGNVDPDAYSGPNHCTLSEGRAMFAKIGVCEAKLAGKVDPDAHLKYLR
jgi:hypothetical protein